MSPKQKGSARKNTFGSGIAIGLILSVVISVMLSMLLAVLVINERVGENTIEYLTPLITLLASFIGCVVAGKQVEEKLAIVIGATGTIYLFLLIGSGILFFDGGFHNLWTSFLTVAVACALSCAICIRGKGGGRKRKRVYR
ncbi:MAG: TIGR04086 family membrane protein [Oscillospiraceae bacterium]|nr:TIGR04086 family membrane protein [Oscillospiraceae bacterium]